MEDKKEAAFKSNPTPNKRIWINEEEVFDFMNKEVSRYKRDLLDEALQSKDGKFSKEMNDKLYKAFVEGKPPDDKE
ncbi:hypothetical protein [Peribacillus sp. NPDC097895]|uniref:hypothetical protein n=1 Tax=Peribacillus sp. NPDC097895 TaxID=3390619 RepID=UPI003D068AA3